MGGPKKTPASGNGGSGDSKRRRVVRACDRCRKLKIKCSGDLPCIHCTVYSYDCTYDEPSKSKKKPQPNLRNAAHDDSQVKIKAFEDVIRKLLPDLDPQQPIDPIKLKNSLNQQPAPPDVSIPDLVDNHGSVGTPPTNLGGGATGMEIKIILPPLNIALNLISNAWEHACVLFRFYHRPSFIKDLNELYSTDPTHYSNKQQRFLPLVYSVLACGALFSKSDENTKLNNSSNDGIGRGGTLIDANIPPVQSLLSDQIADEGDDGHLYDDEGYKYFIAARRLIDITDTRDTYGIQTIVMLIIFLQCSARLSTCYAYIGIALRAALREGLHRKLNYPFNPIDLEIRKRLFWTIYKMDIYVNTMLGLPRTITREDFDQDLPIELDDENITFEGLNFGNQCRVSSSQIANCHTKLIEILKNVVSKLYPVRPKDKGLGSVLTLSYILDLENQLQDWLNSLPIELKPGIEPSPEYLRANRVLHLSYLHVRIVLYRPFIHYIGKSGGNEWMNDKAMNCINVARVVVKLSDDMIKRGILSGAYWFSVYTIFFSIACLIYYVHFSPNSNSVEYLAIKKDAERGKKILDTLKDSSMAARRTYNILNALFEQLNRKTASNGSSIDPVIEDKLNDIIEPFVGDPNTVSNGINFIGGVSTGVDLSRRPTLQGEQGHTIPSVAVDEISGEDGKYAPGLMDQLDTKLFGRFLPPYMTSGEEEFEFEPLAPSTSSKFDPENPLFSTIPSGLSTVLPNGDSLEEFLNIQ